MSVKFKKLAIATAVGASLGFAGMAQANNSLLFPYITTSATAYTFVSLFNDPDPLNAGSGGAGFGHDAVGYHFYYGYKAVGAAATAACTHRDFPVDVTEGALLQFEVGYKLDLPTEFGDPVSYGATLRLENNRLPANSEGFLIVTVPAPVAAEVARGEAAVIDTATGLALTYTANSVPNVIGDFSGTGNVEHVTSWYPRNVVTTSWYALPVGTLAQMTPNSGGGIFGRILPNTDADNQGAYGRAENYTSGSVPNNLRCFGTFTVDNLLTAPFNQGGWMSIVSLTSNTANVFTNVAPDDVIADDILLYKRQQTSAVGSSLDMIQPEVAR